jgi:L-threonylcarbamoyladenylate synthase
VHGGGVIAYPTEAVYGLGCAPLDAHAVRRLLALKQRPEQKGLILVAASFAQLAPFVVELAPRQMQAVYASWPGAVTWLLPARRGVPAWLTGRHATLAVRVTAHPLTSALCRRAGALVSTSANPAGLPPARSALAVRRYFGNSLDALLVGPLGQAARPSTIRDARDGRVVRSGG